MYIKSDEYTVYIKYFKETYFKWTEYTVQKIEYTERKIALGQTHIRERDMGR